MRTSTRTRLAAAISAAMALPTGSIAAQQKSPTIDQFLSPGYPSELVSARKADRIAWLGWERGKRNAFAAAAPNFAPTRLTKFLNDDGIELSELQLSDDGTIALFVRGSEPNKVGWIANPTSFGDGAERAIWAAKDGRQRCVACRPWDVAVAFAGRSVCCIRQGQPDLSRARVAGRNHARRPRRAAVLQGVGPERESALVTRRIEDRIRERSPRSQFDRHLRRQDAHGQVHGAQRRSRRESHVVARRKGDRLHSTPRPAVRPTGARRRRRTRRSAGSSARSRRWSRWSRRTAE